MELWRQCAMWLIECRVLPENHRVTWEGAQVCDLAQALRDGVLLCQLLNNLLPQAVNLREINLRPQMSQFLCLKNIRTFLAICQEKFYLKKNDLFEAFELFDVRDFGKPYNTNASERPFLCSRPFPLEGCAADDEIYSGLSDQIDDTVDEDDDLYDFVEDEDNEGDEIYEDLMRTEEPPETVGVDKRECCLQEIRQTEEKYTATLDSILQHFMKPLEKFLQPHDIESIFINIKELAKTHHSLLEDVRNSILNHGAQNLYQVFINYKERLLLYGHYCSQVEAASKHLDKVSNMREDVRMKLEECSKRANSGRFSLRDLLMVPMQRVLKYHLLLQELLKHTTDAVDKDNLRAGLDAMRDLAQCVNEVKRDNEVIKQITSFQMSIENLTQSLALFGRPKIDGELKICSSEKKSKQDRYAFLFDKAVVICKKKSGETFELKDIIELHHFQIRDETTGEKDNKKWSYMFLLLDCFGRCGYDFYFKTRELKKKWLEQFEMAMSNMCPENSTANNHDFQMHCFEETTSCKACSMLLRGTFFQGYQCTRCKMAAHKECLGRVPGCGRNSGLYEDIHSCKVNNKPKLPMEVCQEYYGLPPPPVGFGQPLQLFRGDIIELTRADVDLSWWEGRNLTAGQVGWFPCQKVQPYISVSTLMFLQKDGGEFAISIKFNMDIRHIKITSCEGLYRINDKKAFRGLIEMIEFYQKNSLKEYFKDVDTTLRIPFKQPEQRGSIRSFGLARARYDFSARDRTELSLREGDTIKILKKGHTGWWKGEVYGRVGLFPSNYVEEDYSDYC
uniref:Osteoclast-stimulating factor 1 n=1 Tax=Poecilia latipinna TaxID=48699 RepID=A0A3B3VIK0_9TELE